MANKTLNDVYKLLIAHENAIRDISAKFKMLESKENSRFVLANTGKNNDENTSFVRENNVNLKGIKKEINDLKIEIRGLKSELKNMQDEIIIELRTGFKTRYQILHKEIVSNSKKIEKLEQNGF